MIRGSGGGGSGGNGGNVVGIDTEAIFCLGGGNWRGHALTHFPTTHIMPRYVGVLLRGVNNCPQTWWYVTYQTFISGHAKRVTPKL